MKSQNSHLKVLINSIFISFFTLFTFTSYSQTSALLEFKDKYEEFDYYAQPDKNNELSNYFQKKLNLELLEALKFTKKDPNKHRVFLRFRLNSKNQIIRVIASSPYKELNDQIVKAFRKYDIEKLNIPEFNELNSYMLQIISEEDGQSIVNCSSHIIYDKWPVFEGCEASITNIEMRSCMKIQIEKHILENLSHDKIIASQIIGDIKLNAKFQISPDGTIFNPHSKAKNDILKEEINRVILTLPSPLTPPQRNGNPTSLYINESIKFTVDSEDGKYEEKLLAANDSIMNATNELALHFKKYISEEDLKSIKFTDKNKRINVVFEFTKKGEMVRLRTNYSESDLKDKILKAFKSFPMEKLKIQNPDHLTYYNYNIISKVGNKVRIQCSEKPTEIKFPIFNKNCEKSKTATDVRKCLQENISYILKRRWDSDVRFKTDLTGDVRILSLFKINEEGYIVNAKVRAPNPFIANQMIEILEKMPRMYEPGYKNGKPFEQSFSITLNFKLGSNPPQKNFNYLGKGN